VATGEPVRISVCHCLNCQKRSGSAFAVQVRFPTAQVTVDGPSKVFSATGDNGAAHFNFCSDCGATICFRNDGMPGTIAIPLGAFADPYAFVPTVSVFEERQHEWLELAGDIEHHE
jgi:hypothetical protein